MRFSCKVAFLVGLSLLSACQVRGGKFTGSPAPFTNSPLNEFGTQAPPAGTDSFNWGNIANMFSGTQSAMTGSALQDFENQVFQNLFDQNSRTVSAFQNGTSVMFSADGKELSDNIQFDISAAGTSSSSSSTWFEISFDHRENSGDSSAMTSMTVQFTGVYEYLDNNGISGYQSGSNDTLVQVYNGTFGSFENVSPSSAYNQFATTTKDGNVTFQVGYSGNTNCTISGVVMNQNQAKIDIFFQNFSFVNKTNSSLCIGTRIISGNSGTAVAHKNFSISDAQPNSNFGALEIVNSNTSSSTNAVFTWAQNVSFDGAAIGVFNTGWTNEGNGAYTTFMCFNSSAHPQSIEWDPSTGATSSGNSQSVSSPSTTSAPSSPSSALFGASPSFTMMITLFSILLARMML